ncbi:MAG: hypothetical protein CM1200mP18_11250 [Gammaproteobacteria bacterium]|nr:MAG: hypothetical protein CM1200mP18_11250 [Gammaproteobacteria bacterium]
MRPRNMDTVHRSAGIYRHYNLQRLIVVDLEDGSGVEFTVPLGY